MARTPSNPGSSILVSSSQMPAFHRVPRTGAYLGHAIIKVAATAGILVMDVEDRSIVEAAPTERRVRAISAWLKVVFLPHVVPRVDNIVKVSFLIIAAVNLHVVDVRKLGGFATTMFAREDHLVKKQPPVAFLAVNIVAKLATIVAAF